MSSHYRTSSHHFRDSTTARKFNKQQFLQANCQFVVLDGHDYTIHKVDPDWPIDWDCIEEVRFKQCATTETTCPICLEPPSAAKITRCGHIYCWSCMLHYLSLSDEKCRQCPICFEPVYKSDLLSVVSHSFINYAVDDEITLKLMNRKKGCVEVEPYTKVILATETHLTEPHDLDSSQNQSCSAQYNGNDHYWSQANLVIVDSNTVIKNIVQRERDELLIKMAIDKDEPGVCFIEQAMKFLDKRIEKLQNRPMNRNHRHHNNNHQHQNSKVVNEFNRPHQQNHILNNSELSKNYLFYQCTDGQHIYLNPFSTKILCHEFKKLENCPVEIKAKILQMDWISMNEGWRKRFRYLGHLPLSCEFRLIEIDFEKSNLISSATFKAYEDQIKRRAQDRQRRRREERKRDKLIQVEQDKKIYGIQPSLKISLNNTDQFPSVSDERYLGLTHMKNSKTTNNQNNYSDYFFSDDDNEFERDQENAPDESSSQLAHDKTVADSTKPIAPDQAPHEPDQGSSCDIYPNLTKLSFRDIQLQEAALVDAKLDGQKSGGQKPTSSSNPWSATTNNQQYPSNNHKQSSFAQLLVDAKASQKVWTRNSSSSQNPNVVNMPNSSGSDLPSHVTRYQKASESDDGGEELRAPPNKFNISDFMDSKVPNGKKKGSKSRRS